MRIKSKESSKRLSFTMSKHTRENGNDDVNLMARKPREPKMKENKKTQQM